MSSPLREKLLCLEIGAVIQYRKPIFQEEPAIRAQSASPETPRIFDKTGTLASNQSAKQPDSSAVVDRSFNKFSRTGLGFYTKTDMAQKGAKLAFVRLKEEKKSPNSIGGNLRE